MILRLSVFVCILCSGCATTGTTTSAQSDAKKCSEGMEAVYEGYGKWSCQALRDVFLKMKKDEFKSKASTLKATALIKSFIYDHKTTISLLVKQEAGAGGIFFELTPPYSAQLNVDKNVKGFHLRYEDVNFFMNTFPNYYSKIYENESLYLRCYLDNYTHNEFSKMLVFQKCKIVELSAE